jgi:hypothetical protein
MAAHSGEKAQKTGDFYCATCDKNVHVTQGDKIPKCPKGHSGFEARRNDSARWAATVSARQQVLARRRNHQPPDAVQSSNQHRSNVVRFTRVGRRRCVSPTDRRSY